MSNPISSRTTTGSRSSPPKTAQNGKESAPIPITLFDMSSNSSSKYPLPIPAHRSNYNSRNSKARPLRCTAVAKSARISTSLPYGPSTRRSWGSHTRWRWPWARGWLLRCRTWSRRANSFLNDEVTSMTTMNQSQGEHVEEYPEEGDQQ